MFYPLSYQTLLQERIKGQKQPSRRQVRIGKEISEQNKAESNLKSVWVHFHAGSPFFTAGNNICYILFYSLKDEDFPI